MPQFRHGRLVDDLVARHLVGLIQPPLGRLGDVVEVVVENVTRVEAGQAFARADGEQLTAEEPFYPVLLSANGYEEIFGYTAERVGTVP